MAPANNDTSGMFKSAFWQTFNEAQEASEDEELGGKTLVNYATSPLDSSQIVLGDRYLERGQCLFFVAPPGSGKSTAAIQMTALWACGKPAFRILPPSPLGIIIFQSEDSSNDLIDMCRVVSHLGLSGVQLALLEANTWIETVKGKLGGAAVRRFRQVIQKRKQAGQKIDLIIINPYSGYLSGDVSSPEVNNQFLRGQLDSLLAQFGIAALIVHHTPKTTNQNTDHWDFWEWMYAGAGSSAISNYTRAFIAIERLKNSELFRFVAAKRGERLPDWQKRELYCIHDKRPGVLLWTEATGSAIKAACAKTRKSLSATQLVALVPALDPIPKTKLYETALAEGFVRASVRAALEDALSNELLRNHLIPNPGARPIAGISRP